MCTCAESLSPTFCDSMDRGRPGSSVYRILQARALEWAATPSPRGPPNPGTEPACLTSPAGQVGFSPLVPRGRPRPVLVYKQVLFGSSSSCEGLINSNKTYSSLVSEIRSTEVSNENGLS